MAIYEGVILEHFRHPRNRGAMAEAEAIGDAVNPLCGDVLQLFLTITSSHIARATFVGDACAICVASASMLTEVLTGLSVSRAVALAADDIPAMLNAQIPAARRQCATLPYLAIGRALGASRAAAGTGLTAVVLAAGSASRFGGGKLTASLRGEPIIRRSVRAIIGAVDRTIVAVAPEASAIRAALEGIDVAFAVNDRPAEGISGSIRAGIAAVAEAQAALIVLGDEPFIPPTVPRALSSMWRSSHAAIVVPRYEDESGHPVLFDRRVFPELMALRGDIGAGPVVGRDTTRVRFVDVHTAPPRDVDTPGDLTLLDSAADLGAGHAPVEPGS